MRIKPVTQGRGSEAMPQLMASGSAIGACAASSSPPATLSRMAAQSFSLCNSTAKPYCSNNPSSLAMTIGAQSLRGRNPTRRAFDSILMPPPFSFSCAEPLPSTAHFLHASTEKCTCRLDHTLPSVSTRRISARRDIRPADHLRSSDHELAPFDHPAVVVPPKSSGCSP